MRARWPAALAALIALGAAGACGGDNLPGWRENNLPPSPVKAFDINQVPRDKVKDGGTLRWGLGEFPSQWNQNHVDGNMTSVDTVMSALMPTPFRSDERGRVSLDLDYVTNARITATSPHQVITYSLNPKAKWSDGKPITWADYAAQWKAMNGQNKAFRVDSTIAYENIQSVTRGSSDHEVVVTLTQPFNEWQSLFSPLYPASANSSPEAFNADWVNKIPVTAGPFKLSSFDVKGKSITLVRDQNWWGDQAKLDKLVFLGVKTDMVRAFTKGEVDVYDVGPAPDDYSRARGAWDAVVRQAAGTDFRQFTFNGESPVLADIRVRQAIAMALDRRALMQLDLKGLGWPAVTLDNHFLSNSQQGYRGNAGDIGTYNPQKAGQLLDEVGWKMSGKTRMRNGTPMNVRFVVPAGVGVSDTEAEVTRLMLRRIGVGVTIQTVPFNDFFTKYLIPGNFDITAFSYPSTPYPISNAFDVYAYGENTKGDDMKWYSNLGRTGSREIDQAMYRAGSVSDPGQIAELVNAADELVWRQINVLPLYQSPQNVAVRSTLANVGANGFYDLRYADIGFTS
ncbi:hypothetical protein Pth03_32360 [Planotetraspora thailandica]|uniref:Solute-binding protein family 5 domain-containing protein n=1 Tax=Planotetraspora thailandica TaxID=487172 RepID=A0A8J3XTY3_9ACTN|nr:ABC transporter family substrate-binding protein [Planotetraspora thailandica]GII54847.1 hypothetical protein Pth03_32360 [Planotetraspora thailandica]